MTGSIRVYQIKMVGIVKPMEGSILYLQLKDKEFLYLEGLQLQNLTNSPA